MFRNPQVKLGISFTPEGDPGFPDVLRHMDEIQHDQRPNTISAKELAQHMKLVRETVYEHDHRFEPFGIRVAGFPDGLLAHFLRTFFYACPDPLILRTGPVGWFSLVAWRQGAHNILRCAHMRRYGIDGCHRGHSLRVALLPR